jgi:hypothetical protein
MTNPTGPEGQDTHAAGQQAQMSVSERIDAMNKKRFEERKAVRAEELEWQQAQREADLRDQLRARKQAQKPIQNLPQEEQTQIQVQASTRMQAAMRQAGMTLNEEFKRLGQPGSNTRSVDPARVAAVQQKITEPRAAHRQQSQERGGQSNDR